MDSRQESDSLKRKKILIAGSGGMVGKALVRKFRDIGARDLLTPTRQELDYTSQLDVREYFQFHQPEVVLLAAAKVGGILANATYPAEFLYDNIMIASNIIHQAHLAGIDRLLFLGSTCIYPKYSPQPISEEFLLTGSLEPTNEAYAIAKIAGVKLCEYYCKQYARKYISVMPTNLYGPGDNYNLQNSHVLPALLRRFHQAKFEGLDEVSIWGSGKPKREFLHVDDLADACLFLLNHYYGEFPVNVGSQDEVTIKQLADLIAGVVGFQGKISCDPTMPDGTPRKKTDTTRLASLGWKAKIGLHQGLNATYQDFLKENSNFNLLTCSDR